MKESRRDWEVEAQWFFPSQLAGALGEGSLGRRLMESFYSKNQRQVECILIVSGYFKFLPSLSMGTPQGHTPLASLVLIVMLWFIHCASR